LLQSRFRAGVSNRRLRKRPAAVAHGLQPGVHSDFLLNRRPALEWRSAAERSSAPPRADGHARVFPAILARRRAPKNPLGNRHRVARLGALWLARRTGRDERLAE